MLALSLCIVLATAMTSMMVYRGEYVKREQEAAAFKERHQQVTKRYTYGLGRLVATNQKDIEVELAHYVKNQPIVDGQVSIEEEKLQILLEALAYIELANAYSTKGLGDMRDFAIGDRPHQSYSYRVGEKNILADKDELFLCFKPTYSMYFAQLPTYEMSLLTSYDFVKTKLDTLKSKVSKGETLEEQWEIFDQLQKEIDEKAMCLLMTRSYVEKKVFEEENPSSFKLYKAPLQKSYTALGITTSKEVKILKVSEGYQFNKENQLQLEVWWQSSVRVP